MGITVIKAADWMKPGRTTVECAVDLGQHVGRLLGNPDGVLVSFKDVRGISSSYFNALFVALREVSDASTILATMKFETDSQLQRSILERSLRAVFPGPIGSTN